MSMTNPYHYETADALDATWTTAGEAALCLIETALHVEDDPHWIDELHERREAACATLRNTSVAGRCAAKGVHQTATSPSAAANEASHDARDRPRVRQTGGHG